MRFGPGLTILAVTGVLGACAAVGPEPEAAAPDLPPAYAFAPDADPGVDPGAGPASDAAWWTGFEDPALNALIEAGLDGNRDITAALARLEAAQAQIVSARSGLFPGVDGEVSLEAQTEPGDSETETDAQGAGLLSYSPDLFGRQRRAIAAARADAAAQADLADDVRRLTAASIASQYLALARAEARFALLETSLDLQRQTLDIVTQRFDAGLSAGLDVQRAEADLARTRAQRGTLTIARAQALNTLAVLTGRTLAGWTPPEPDAIPAFTGEIAAGAPAALLRRRPDVRAAEADLEAALARVGVARAALYPQLSLPGSITADLDPAGFADSVTARIAAVVDIPLFDAGARRADITAAEARASAALADYEQTVLLAVADVETALSRIAAIEARRTELARAVTASETAFDQLNALYREGLATFIDILDAQRTLINSREAAVNADAELAQAVIDLHAALGAQAYGSEEGAADDALR